VSVQVEDLLRESLSPIIIHRVERRLIVPLFGDLLLPHEHLFDRAERGAALVVHEVLGLKRAERYRCREQPLLEWASARCEGIDRLDQLLPNVFLRRHLGADSKSLVRGSEPRPPRSIGFPG
jgi:hypothetical protein